MDKDNSIFRPEALQYQKNSWLGDFTVSAPSVLPIALFCAISILLMMTLLLFTPYAQRVPVVGRVIYVPAAAEVVFDHDGVIGSIKIHQGEKVKKGDIIATISRDVNYAGGGMNQALHDSVQHQLFELQRWDKERLKESIEERQHLRDKISAKDNEISVIQKAVSAELDRGTSLKKRMEFYQQLFKKGLTTVQETIERENEYHDYIAQLSIYRINIARTQGERLQLIDELTRSISQEKKSSTEIQQQKFTLQQQIIRTAALVESYVIASLDGVIGSTNIQESQKVIAGEIAAVIVPENACPYIEMWILPSMLHEVKTDQHVLMRVASIPWEWFGKVQGTVVAISSSPETLKGNNQKFRVLIIPDGNTRTLPAGVEVEADILTTHRRVWEWLLSPLKHNINRITTES